MWNVDVIKDGSHKKSESWVMARSLVGNDCWDHLSSSETDLSYFFSLLPNIPEVSVGAWRWNQKSSLWPESPW